MARRDGSSVLHVCDVLYGDVLGVVPGNIFTEAVSIDVGTVGGCRAQLNNDIICDGWSFNERGVSERIKSESTIANNEHCAQNV